MFGLVTVLNAWLLQESRVQSMVLKMDRPTGNKFYLYRGLTCYLCKYGGEGYVCYANTKLIIKYICFALKIFFFLSL